MGLAYDKILWQCNKYIAQGHISAREYNELEKYMFEPYQELGGNGTAAKLMDEVRKLPTKRRNDMKLNDKVYDVLKWIALIFLPAFAVFYGAVGPVWDWFRPDDVVFTIVAVDTFLGALLGVSTAQYNKEGM